MSATTIATAIVGLLLVWSQIVFAAPNMQVNYQGKLTDDGGVSVTDGDYNMRFYLYNTTGGATTTAIWTEEWLVSASNGVPVTNGLFSTMLGSTTDISGVDFNQTLYLGVEIGGTGVSPTWDGEMSPRKILGTVPAAFEAQQLDGLATSSFLRADEADTLEASSTGSLLTLIQNGTGAIFDAINSSAESVFKVFDNGIVAVGTSTADSIATSTGLAVVNKDVEVLVGDLVEIGSEYTTSNAARDFVVRGDYAYVLSGLSGDDLDIIDISDPTSPVKVNGVDYGGVASAAIDVSGNYLYIARDTGTNGFKIYDVSDPTKDIEVASVGSASSNNVVRVYGQYVFLGNDSSSGEVEIWDVSDPSNPVSISSINADASVNDLAVRGNYLYAASESAGDDLEIFDISDIENPIKVGSVGFNTDNSNAIALNGTIAYVGGNDLFTVLDISDPTSPTVIESTARTAGDDVRDIDVAGNFMFLATTNTDGDEIDVFDISSSTNPVKVGKGDLPDDGIRVSVKGEYLHALSNGTGGDFHSFKLPSLITPTANIGNLVSNDIESDYVRVTQSLTADGSLNVGTNALIGGALTITGTASSSLQSSNTNAALVVTSGYVGIGTTSPYADLAVDGNIGVTGGIFDSSNTLGTNGQILQTTGSGLQWVSTSTLGLDGSGGSSLFTDGGDITYLTDTTDVLAIGTTTDVATSTGLAVYNRDIEVLIGTGTPMRVVGAIEDSVSTALRHPGEFVARGDYLYVLSDSGEDTEDGLQILDISDPSNPVGLGSTTDDGTTLLLNPLNIQVAGNYAYIVSEGEDGVQIIDISNPTNPIPVASIADGENGADTLASSSDIVIDGRYAYVTSNAEHGVQVLDISDPLNPRGVSSIIDEERGATLLRDPVSIKKQGNYLTVIAAGSIQIIDASDPTNLIGLGEVFGGSNLQLSADHVVDGNYLYGAARQGISGVSIWDISDPTATPSLVGSISDDSNGADTLASAYKLDKFGNYLVVSGFIDDGVQLIDVSSTTNPVGVGSIREGEQGATELFRASGVLVHEGHIYVGNVETGMQVLSLPTLITPTAEIGNLLADDIETDYLRVTQALAVDGSLNVGTNAMVGGVLHITGNASSTLQGETNQASLAVVSGGIGIGTTTFATSTGLAVYNKDIEITIGTGTPLRGIGSITDDGTLRLNGPRGMDKQGDLLYVVEHASGGFQVLDISDPTNPVGVGQVADGDTGFPNLGGARSVAVRGDYAYVTSITDDAFTVIDVSDPTNMTSVFSVTDTAELQLNGASEVTIDGNYAYITAFSDNGVQVFDISDPTNPVSVGSITDGNNGATELAGAVGITIRGNYAYVNGNSDNGVQILDISDPTNIVGLGEVTTVTSPGGASALKGNYLYVPSLGDTVDVIDVSDLNNPVEVGSISDADPGTQLDSPRNIRIAGDYAFVPALTSNAIQVLDISDPTNPVAAGFIRDGENGADELDGARALLISGNYIYVAGYDDDGIQVLDMGGLVTPTAEIGNLYAGVIETGYLRVTQSLVANSSLNVGSNAMIGGTLTVVGNASSSLQGEVTNAALAVTSGGIGIGTSTFATSTGLTVYNKDIEITIGTGTPLVARDSIRDGEDGATELNRPLGFVVRDDIAYVNGSSDDGIQILDVSDPDNITVITNLTDGTNNVSLDGPFNSQLVGNYLYVTVTNDDLVQVIDVSNPANPVGVSSISSSSEVYLNGPRAIKVRGNYAYVFSEISDRLQVLDISDPTNLVALGSVSPGLVNPLQMQIVGNYAFLTDTSSGRNGIIDISDPNNPIDVYSTPTATTEGVAVRGNYAYYSLSSGGIRVFDISDISSPTTVTTISEGANGTEYLDPGRMVIVNDTLLLVSEDDNAIQIMDISSSTNPVGVGAIVHDGVDVFLEGAYDLQVEGQRLYVIGSDSDSFQIFDLPSLITPTAEIGNLLADNIESDYLRVTQALTVDGSLNVGTNAMIGGTLSIVGTASSSLQGQGTNAALAITSGALGVGISSGIATGTGIAVQNKDIELIIGTGTPMRGVGSVADGENSATVLASSSNMEIVGDRMYVTAPTDNGIQILDISDPTNPTGIGSITDGTNGADELTTALNIDVQGNYAYVVSSGSEDGFQILDISNPANIRGVGSVSDGNNGATLLNGAYDVSVVGDYAYVVSSVDNGFQVIDISDPTNPTGVGALADAGSLRLAGALDLEVVGSYAYVVSYDDDGFQVIDISDPRNPVGVGNITDDSNGADTLFGPSAVAIQGSYAYVSTFEENGMQIIDISDPTNPTGVGSITDGNNGATTLFSAQGITVAGDYVFVTSLDDAGGAGVQIIDVSSSTNPVGVGAIRDGELGASRLFGAYDVEVHGNYVYVASVDEDAIQVLSLSGFTAPTAEIGNLLATDIETDYLRVTQSLVADSGLNVGTNAMIGGMLTVGGSASSSLEESTDATLTVLSGAIGIGTSTDIATTTGLAVYNKDIEISISTGTPLTAVGSITEGENGTSELNEPYDFDIQGSYAYVVSPVDNGLQIIDISDPTNMVGVGIAQDGVNGADYLDSVVDIQVRGNYAYVVSAGSEDAMEIFDISDPTNPTSVGSITDGSNGADTLNNPNFIKIAGNYAYVYSFTDSGIQVIDISDPTNPRGVSDIVDNENGANALTFGYGLDIRGNYLYVSAANALQVIDISDPYNLVGLDAGTVDNGGRNMAIRGQYAYVVSESGGTGSQFTVMDITDPSNVFEVAAIAFSDDNLVAMSTPNEVALAGNYAFVGGRASNGVQVIDISSSTNPFGAGAIFDDETDTNSPFDTLDDPRTLKVQGNYLYVLSNDDDGLQAIRIPSVITPTAEIGNLLARDIQTDFVRVTESLMADGSLNVGTNALIGGTLTITGIASSSLQSGNNNPALSVVSGYFGIGTTTPFTDLAVAGDVALTGGIYDINASLGTSGMVLQTSGTSFEWVATSSLNIPPGASEVFTDGGDITYLTTATDAVAIGVTSGFDSATTGLAVYNRDIEIILGTSSPLVGVGSISDGDGGALIGSPREIAIQGDYAYVNGTDGDEFQILDISDPENPVALGSATDLVTPGVDTMIDPSGLVVRGNYAYIVGGAASGRSGLQIIDISDPMNPIGVGSIAQGERGATELQQARTIALKGNYAYITGQTSWGVEVIDISDPTYPYSVGAISSLGNTLNGPRDIKIRGDYAYVTTDSTDSLTILDISDPANPISIGALTDTIETALDFANYVDIQGNYAYVTAANSLAPEFGMQIIDISDPTNPTAVASTSFGMSSPHDVKVIGDYAFVASQGNDTVLVIDVSSSTNPVTIGSIADGENGADELNGPHAFAVKGQYLYVTGRNDYGVQVLKINGALKTPTANIGNLLTDTLRTDYLSVTQSLIADSSLNVGTNALVGGSLTITGTASSSLQGAGTLPALNVTSGALAVGTSTGIATSTGLAVVNQDVQLTAGTPTLVGTLTLNGASVDNMDIVDDYAYFAFDDAALNEFQIVSIADPTNPVSIASLELGDDVNNVKVVGNYAYVVGDDYFGIIDVSNPYNPLIIDTETVFDDFVDIAIQGGFAYITSSNFSSDDEFFVFDISDPNNITLATSLALPEPARTIEVVGNYAYIGIRIGSPQLQIYDISDPYNPTFVADDTVSESINDMEVDGNRIYAGTNFGSPRLDVLDISDPTNVGRSIPLTFDESVITLDLAGDYLYIGTLGDTDDPDIWIWDTTVPYSTFTGEIVGSIDVSTGGEDIEKVLVHDGYLYVATELTSNNFRVYDIGSFITPTAEIGSLASNNIETDYLRVTNSFVNDGSLNVGTNALIGGSLTITGTPSTTVQSANTSPALVIASGYVGVGTTSPYANLSIAGDLTVTGGLYDTNTSRGTSGDLLQSTGSAVDWISSGGLGIVSGGSSLFTDGGDITYLTSLTDVLAIGTTTDVATSTGLAVYNRDVEVLAGNPTLVTTVTDGDASGATELDRLYEVVLKGDYAYVSGENDDGVSVLDISDPNNPVAVANILRASADITHMNDPLGMDIQGNYLYVTGNSSSAEEGLQIIDISDPTNPIGVGGIGDGEAGADTLAEAADVKVAGNYAYVTSGGDNGLQIIDISDPTNPIGVGSITDGNNGATELNSALIVQVRGDYAYVASPGDNGFQVIDVSDPTNPTGLGEITDSGSINFSTVGDFVLKGKYAYITSFGEDAINVVDISDPNNPTVVNSVVDGTNGANQLDGVEGIALAGNYLYAVSSIDGAIQVLDISSSTNPVGVGELTGLVDGTQIAVHRGYIYATANGEDDLNIARIPTLTTPTADIGNLLSDDIETSYLTVTQALKTDSLNVNTNSMIGGTLTITGTASSALISSHSNVALNVTSGDVVIGTSTDVISGLQIGYGGICVDNDGECDTTVAGRIASVSTFSGNSDLAETYFSSAPLEPGDIVELESGLSINQAVSTSTNTIIGVVSTKPGVLLGYDDVSLEEGENAYPIALKGRVPVKVSTENGPINAGDQLMLSSIPGTAMKATGTGAVVGIALEAFDPDEDDPYYSDTFINQFTDDLPSTADVDTITEQLQASTTETIELDDTDVLQGQIVMFVDLDYRYIDEATNNQLASLIYSDTDDADSSLFDRALDLARGFVDGALSIFTLEAEKVEVVDELCINGTCIQSDDLRVLIESLDEEVTQVTIIEDEGPADQEIVVDMSGENDDIVTAPVASSTTPQTSTTTTNSGENTASSSDQISDNIETASTTTTGGDLVNDETASSSENSIVEPQNEDVQQEEVADETPVQEEPASEETPVSSEQETDETPEEDTPPEPEVVEEVDTPDEEEPVEEETDVNQETS